MANKPFDKFIQTKESGAKKKERIRQEKKKIRKETQEYFDKKKEEKRLMREQYRNQRQPNPYTNQSTKGGPAERPVITPKSAAGKIDTKKPIVKAGTKTAAAETPATKSGAAASMPLNKYIAHAGICSRRDAADVVRSGKVVVNGQKVLEPGFKVKDSDEIKVQGKKIFAQRNLVYILLNKPKDFITTTEDPQDRVLYV